MIQMMRKAGLNLAQPGQSLLGWWTVCASLSRPFSMVRDTNFVEVGPLFVADPQFAKEILPFPRDTGMGWGVEADSVSDQAKPLSNRGHRRVPSSPPWCLCRLLDRAGVRQDGRAARGRECREHLAAEELQQALVAVAAESAVEELR